MVTREAADQEQRTLTRDIIQLKESLAQKVEELKVKDTRITELQLLGTVASGVDHVLANSLYDREGP
jgi:hypothetical protein